MQMIPIEKNTIPIGSVRTFGEYGIPYIVGTPEKQLPDGDWLVNIELPESGEKTQYKLSKIMHDPKAN
ncbi:DUF5397 family protein [Stenoxybacter acetivorans]|uniref:DUF5397 family protein n=1 Tax=Stenoxybacter acetivorans TaxID=422441 RepID=UPI000A5A7209|nr:DUF5397 family protein [Stenoxybacter acetivorans]